MSRGRPFSTPPSVSASARRNTYAGPEPDRPVTASSIRSGTRTTIPTAPRIRSARSRSASVASVPAAMADAPCRTTAGVFGIARTTGRPGAASSSSAIVIPAAIESTSACSGSDGAADSSAADTCWGLSATITTSASATAHAGLGTTRIPRSSVSIACRRSGSISATAMSSASKPASSSPATRASPMRPPPSNAMRITQRGYRRALHALGQSPHDAGGPEERSTASHFPERSGFLHLGPHPAGTRRRRPVHRTDPTGAHASAGNPTIRNGT